MLQSKDRLDGFSVALLTGLCLLWGIQQVVIKVAAAEISPLLQAGLRSGGAALLVLLWMLWRRQALWRHDGSLWPGLLAGLLFAAEFALLFHGLTLTSVSRGTILLYTAPFWVALGSHLLLPGERIGPVQVVGLAMAFCGVVLTFAGGAATAPPDALAGDALMLGAAVMWAATSLVIKGSALRHVAAAKTLLYQLGISAPVLLLGAVAAGEALVVPPTPLALGALAFQIFVIASASYLAWFWLMRIYPVSRLSSFSFLTPVFGVACGALYLGEPLSPAVLAALALVAAGIYLVNRPAAP